MWQTILTIFSAILKIGLDIYSKYLKRKQEIEKDNNSISNHNSQIENGLKELEKKTDNQNQNWHL